MVKKDKVDDEKMQKNKKSQRRTKNKKIQIRPQKEDFFFFSISSCPFDYFRDFDMKWKKNGMVKIMQLEAMFFFLRINFL